MKIGVARFSEGRTAWGHPLLHSRPFFSSIHPSTNHADRPKRAIENGLFPVEQVERLGQTTYSVIQCCPGPFLEGLGPPSRSPSRRIHAEHHHDLPKPDAQGKETTAGHLNMGSFGGYRKRLTALFPPSLRPIRLDPSPFLTLLPVWRDALKCYHDVVVFSSSFPLSWMHAEFLQSQALFTWSCVGRQLF
jgi:hypothetical protein